MKKLIESEVKEIREEYAKGRDTCRTLAVKYGVCKSNIEWVLNGKTWKKVSIPEWLAERILKIKIRNSRSFMGNA